MILYHYTNAKGLAGILGQGQIRPSLKASNPKDARYGDGQYFSDVLPGTRRLGQLSYLFIGNPYQGRRFTHYVAMDVQGLRVVQGRRAVYVAVSAEPLPIADRIRGYGRST